MALSNGVAKVVWVPDPDQRKLQYNVLSLGSDGKVLIWQQDKEVKNHQLLLIQRYQLFSSSISRSIGVSDVMTAPSVGGKCICVCVFVYVCVCSFHVMSNW